MTTIKIVKETGCFMYMDENNNMKDYFFINGMTMDHLSNELLTILKTRLEMEKVVPYFLYKNIVDDSLYLICKNRKYIADDALFTFKYDNSGNETALRFEYFEKHIENNNAFHLMHDFSKVGILQ